MSDNTERWLPWPSNEHYLVSDRGKVRSIRHKTPVGHRGGNLLKASPDGDGYPSVRPGGGGRNRSVPVHVMVLETFDRPRPPGMQARHLNDVKTDNRWPENLCWGTPTENYADGVRNGSYPGTHCPNGHLYTPETTMNRTKNGKPYRSCRICSREQLRRSRARRAQNHGS